MFSRVLQMELDSIVPKAEIPALLTRADPNDDQDRAKPERYFWSREVFVFMTRFERLVEIGLLGRITSAQPCFQLQLLGVSS